MRKILLALLITIVLNGAALAETLKVEALTSFNTVNPPSSIQVRSIGEIQLTSKIKINEGDIITGSLTDIKDPKRLKRDASFKFKIKSVTHANGQTVKVKENNIAKYVPPFKLDKKEVAKDAALAVGNHFVEGLSMGYHAVEGAIKSEEGGGKRITSAAKNVYENSVLSYASKGDEIEIQSGEIFGLKINSKEEIDDYQSKNAPNYTYEIPTQN